MKKEKVLWFELPKDRVYRKVIAAKDGKIGIVYSGEDINQLNICKEVVIPKPQKLIGGTEVYQKEGSPYWYCKLKNGRDEFMHLYFEDLTEVDLYCALGKVRELDKLDKMQLRLFRDKIVEALENKPIEGYRWIPVFEPSSAENGEIEFVKGKKTLTSYNGNEWRIKLKEYSPENESQMCSIEVYFLLLLRWIKDGIISIEKPIIKHTGEMQIDDLYCFAGNTLRFVEGCLRIDAIGHFGNRNGDISDLIIIERDCGKSFFEGRSFGLLELKK